MASVVASSLTETLFPCRVPTGSSRSAASAAFLGRLLSLLGLSLGASVGGALSFLSMCLLELPLAAAAEAGGGSPADPLDLDALLFLDRLMLRLLSTVTSAGGKLFVPPARIAIP